MAGVSLAEAVAMAEIVERSLRSTMAHQSKVHAQRSTEVSRPCQAPLVTNLAVPLSDICFPRLQPLPAQQTTQPGKRVGPTYKLTFTVIANTASSRGKLLGHTGSNCGKAAPSAVDGKGCRILMQSLSREGDGMISAE